MSKTVDEVSSRTYASSIRESEVCDTSKCLDRAEAGKSIIRALLTISNRRSCEEVSTGASARTIVIVCSGDNTLLAGCR